MKSAIQPILSETGMCGGVARIHAPSGMGLPLWGPVVAISARVLRFLTIMPARLPTHEGLKSSPQIWHSVSIIYAPRPASIRAAH